MTELAKKSQASVLENLDGVRAMIKRHKRNDIFFSIIGLIALMIGLLTLCTLFIDLVMDGYPRFNMDFFCMGRFAFGDDSDLF